MKTKIIFRLYLLIGFNTHIFSQTAAPLNLIPTSAPFTLTNNNDSFYENISYGDSGINNDFDVSANLGLVTFGAYNNDNLTNIDLGAISYTNFNYFKISSNDNLTFVFTDNPSDFEIGGALNTAIGSSYAADATTTFVLDAAACNALLVVKKFDLINYNLYPNPAKEIISISVTEDVKYKVLNSRGQLFKSGNLSRGNNKLIIDTLSNGMYFFQITTGSGNSFAQKLVKI